MKMKSYMEMVFEFCIHFCNRIRPPGGTEMDAKWLQISNHGSPPGFEFCAKSAPPHPPLSAREGRGMGVAAESRIGSSWKWKGRKLSSVQLPPAVQLRRAAEGWGGPHPLPGGWDESRGSLRFPAAAQGKGGGRPLAPSSLEATTSRRLELK